MRLYLKRSSNVDSLSCAEQKTIGKRFLEQSLWREINVTRSDNWVAIINKVEEAFTTIVPSFVRKVRFLDINVHQGEGPIEWASRIDEEADLAHPLPNDIVRLKTQAQKTD